MSFVVAVVILPTFWEKKSHAHTKITIFTSFFTYENCLSFFIFWLQEKKICDGFLFINSLYFLLFKRNDEII